MDDALMFTGRAAWVGLAAYGLLVVLMVLVFV
jgi:hypothetical protein